jgi:diguanylate cyclase (GGDEF)-like protein
LAERVKSPFGDARIRPMRDAPSAPHPPPRRSGRAGGGPRLSFLYAALGAVLGIGAPAGALLLRALAGTQPSEDLSQHRFFYLYGLVGTCGVFAAAGWVAGRRADALRSGRDRFRELSERDPLTGLWNVSTFRRHYERAAEHAAATGEPLALLIVDVDGLKALNDAEGHSFGSAVLLHAARALEQSKRLSDVAARWGGDEFALLMPGAREDAASRISEQVLARLRAVPVRAEGRERRVSVTIGVAACVGAPREDLFHAADRALYEAKRSGKGRISVAS